MFTVYRVITAAIARKVSAFVSEVRGFVHETEAEVERVEEEAKAEVLKLRDALVTKISKL